MPILTPTKARGATTKPMPMVYVEPACAITDTDLAQQLSLSGLNAPFLADLLSGVLTHERCGRHLYRAVEARTFNPILKAKYREFGEETERHVEILEDLITQMGGNPNYVSPAARAIEGMDSKLVESTYALSGSLDLMTAEMAMLDAVFLAESADHANWKMMRSLCDQLRAGDLQDAFRAAADEVEAQEDEHLGWASETKMRLVMLQARNSVMANVGEKAEEIVARIKGWFTE
jgi:rubrerythrin